MVSKLRNSVRPVSYTHLPDDPDFDINKARLVTTAPRICVRYECVPMRFIKHVYRIHTLSLIHIFTALSAFYVTAPWGFSSENSFLNAACCVESVFPAIYPRDNQAYIGISMDVKSTQQMSYSSCN